MGFRKRFGVFFLLLKFVGDFLRSRGRWLNFDRPQGVPLDLNSLNTELGSIFKVKEKLSVSDCPSSHEAIVTVRLSFLAFFGAEAEPEFVL